jgi:succinate dehydrogenase/fumarate reductase flavoprotein subunit
MLNEKSGHQVSRRRFLREAAVAAPGIAAANALNASAKTTPSGAIKWDKEADVVVIGSGLAGLSAAITVKDAGANVVVLEKMPRKHEGGNSRVSGNMWWTPTNLPEALQYMEALSNGLTDKESLRALAEEMLKLNDWLQQLGVKPTPLGIFQPEHPELPGSKCVRTWSNNGAGDGKLWAPIREQVEKRGIEVLYETPAKDLISSVANRETLGVKALSGGKLISIKARRGVILACGGFEFDFEMQKQFLPGWPTYGRGTPGNTGDGIRMAQKAGAALWHMNNSLAGLGCMIVPEFDPVMIPAAIPGNGYIAVDKTGRRFMNELRENRHGFGHKENLLYFDGVLGDFTRIPCFAIFDENTRTRGPIISGGMKFGWFGWFCDYQASRDNTKEIEKGWILKGDTLADLAKKLEIKPAELEASVARYNGFCKDKVDPDFGRPARSLVTLEKPPFYCIKLYPATFNTQGGPRRNPRCEIVDPDNQPIPRLYSAGELGSFWGWMYNGGGNNAEALCTGQIAGRNVAASKPWK